MIAYRCPHCGGSLVRMRELDGYEIRCMACNRRPDEAFRQVQPGKLRCLEAYCRALPFDTAEELERHQRMNHQPVSHAPRRSEATPSRVDTEREALIRQAVNEAWTLQELGDKLGVSRERARQLLAERELDKSDRRRKGSATQVTKPNEAQLQAHHAILKTPADPTLLRKEMGKR